MSLKKISLKKKIVAIGLAMALGFFALQDFDSNSEAQGVFDQDFLDQLNIMSEIMNEISGEIVGEIAGEILESTADIVREDDILPEFTS